MGTLVSVRTFASRMEAEVARSYLEAHGVAALVRDESLVAPFLWAPPRIEVLVPADHLDEAARLLGEVPRTPGLREAREPPPRWRRGVRIAAAIMLLAAALVPVVGLLRALLRRE